MVTHLFSANKYIKERLKYQGFFKNFLRNVVQLIKDYILLNVLCLYSFAFFFKIPLFLCANFNYAISGLIEVH